MSLETNLISADPYCGEGSRDLRVLGRTLNVPKFCGRLSDFTFSQLCEQVQTTFNMRLVCDILHWPITSNNHTLFHPFCVAICSAMYPGTTLNLC